MKPLKDQPMSWLSAWEQVVPFLAFSQPIRRAIYTTNAVESLNSTVRRAVRTRGHVPNDRAATKLIYLALRAVQRKWRATAALLAPGAPRTRDSLRRALRGGSIMTGRRDSHRLPTGAWATEGPGPRPWTARGNRSVHHFRGEPPTISASSGRSVRPKLLQ